MDELQPAHTPAGRPRRRRRCGAACGPPSAHLPASALCRPLPAAAGRTLLPRV